jgi:hypothetical protein
MPRLTLSLPTELGGRQSAGRARESAEAADHRLDGGDAVAKSGSDGDAVGKSGSDTEAAAPAILRWFDTWAEPRSP